MAVLQALPGLKWKVFAKDLKGRPALIEGADPGFQKCKVWISWATGSSAHLHLCACAVRSVEKCLGVESDSGPVRDHVKFGA